MSDSTSNKPERALVVFFHYHKAASRAAGKPQITIHYRGKCTLVGNLVCRVPTRGRINLKAQPHFVIVGAVKPSEFTVVDGIAYIGKQP